MKQFIIFTDLDGTLLDYSTYSFEAALPALQLIKEQNIPLIICSSKTRAEIEHYRKELDNRHPFVSENGGGIYIPKDYFKYQISNIKFQIEKTDNYHVIRLGAQYTDLRKALQELRSEGLAIRGFGDMTAKEIAELANMGTDEAEMAKARDFDEPFVFSGSEDETRMLLQGIKKKGFDYTQGRFFHILGKSDKGKAVTILIDLYNREYGDITTLAIGDSLNDIPMLESVEIPVIVQKEDGRHESRIHVSNLIKADGIGPEGWNRAILSIIAESKMH